MAPYVGQGSYINYPDPLLAATSSWPQAYYGGNLARYTSVKTTWVIFLPGMSQILTKSTKLLTPYGMRPFLQMPSSFLLMAVTRYLSLLQASIWMSFSGFQLRSSSPKRIVTAIIAPFLIGGQTRVLTLFLSSIPCVLSFLVMLCIVSSWLPSWCCLDYRPKEI